MKNNLRSKRIRLVAIIILVAVALMAVIGGLSFAPAHNTEVKEVQTDEVQKTADSVQNNKPKKAVAAEVTEEEAEPEKESGKDPEKETEKEPEQVPENELKESVEEAADTEYTPESEEEEKITVYFSIDCISALSMELDEALIPFIPEDGIILSRREYSCNRGTSVYDVLSSICMENDIQFEASYSPIYGSYYVEGIGYLYEFAGGDYSGWVYTVNGSRPSVGASSYELKGGDEVVWSYTTTG